MISVRRQDGALVTIRVSHALTGIEAVQTLVRISAISEGRFARRQRASWETS